MKKIIFINTVSIVLVVAIWSVTTTIVNANGYEPNDTQLYSILGFVSKAKRAVVSNALNTSSEDINKQNIDVITYDDLQVVIEDTGLGGLDVLKEYESSYGNIDASNIKVDSDMKYHNSFYELPLYPEDYYWRKYENAVAGVIQLNTMPILHAGDRISVIGDVYINIKAYNGYLKPGYGYGFASGVCWSTSALGLMMDEANKDFETTYQIPLFVFGRYDRAPHSHHYRTYHGGGYTILQKHTGVAVQDYKFTVNPNIANHPDLKDFKLKIVMIATNSHKTATYGQSIGSFIISNYEF